MFRFLRNLVKHYRQEKAMAILAHARYYVGKDFDAIHILTDAYFRVAGER